MYLGMCYVFKKTYVSLKLLLKANTLSLLFHSRWFEYSKTQVCYYYYYYYYSIMENRLVHNRIKKCRILNIEFLKHVIGAVVGC